MGLVRRVLLSALPKLLLSRAVRLVANTPVPRPLRRAAYGAYARRYGADLSEMQGALGDFRTLAEFFQRSLATGARPIDPEAPLVWPADGRVVSSGPVLDGRLLQIKDVHFSLHDLLVHDELARRFHAGSQATVYLAPGDYHRVHSPFCGEVLRSLHVPGGLYPVNPGAVRSIPRLFTRNERTVLEYRLQDGRAAAVVLVAALNVSDTVISCSIPGPVQKGEEIGRFGMGSTVVALVAEGEPAFPLVPPESLVRVGRGVSA